MEPTGVHKLSVAVAESCRHLTTLSFLLGRSSYVRRRSEEERLSLNTFRPLFSCSKLMNFEITHQYPLALQLDDVEEIASKWPLMETLTLNDSPLAGAPVNDKDPSLVTLRSLLSFARHCPQLRHLGLLLQASAIDIPPAHEVQYFQKLKHLSVGCSHLAASEGAVALFLSQICPVGCKIESKPI
jgi:hypothetical protein